MSSRRRNSKKNLGTNLSDIQRRLRRMERKPIRTRLQNRVIKGAAIAPSSITADEVGFGTNIVSTENPEDFVNLKDGQEITNPNTGEKKVYDELNDEFITIKDPAAQASADGKNKIYRQTSQPTGGTYVQGDTWFDTDDDNKIYRYDGTSWVGFTLGDGALASISANKLTAGTIDARVITVSYLDAGNITSGTITGRTLQTSASGRKVIIDGSNNYIRLDDQTGTATAFITPLTIESLGDYGIFMHSGSTVDTTGATAGAGIFIAEYATRIYAQDRASFIRMDNGQIEISADNATFATIILDSTEVYISKLNGQAIAEDPTSDMKVRNIMATNTAGTPTYSGGAGDIMLVYT